RHGLFLEPNWDWLSTFDNFTIATSASQTIDHVVVTPPTSTVVLGSPATFAATAYDAANAVIPNAVFHWSTSSSRPRLATAGYYAPSATAWGISEATSVTATPPFGPVGSAVVAVDGSRVLIYDSFTGPSATNVTNHVPDLDTSAASWWTFGLP